MSAISDELQPHPAWADVAAPCVLVVDDEPTFCSVMGDILHVLGCTVHCAYSAAEALETLETVTPHLILTDVMMPDSDGLSLLRRLRSEPKWSHIPAIVVSAKAMREDAIEARSAGADGWLPKPFSIRDLRAAIRPYLPSASA
ncbi:MAG: response regulator [Anaerolineales bacterium]